jgi:hypothetical protein
MLQCALRNSERKTFDLARKHFGNMARPKPGGIRFRCGELIFRWVSGARDIANIALSKKGNNRGAVNAVDRFTSECRNDGLRVTILSAAQKTPSASVSNSEDIFWNSAK